MIESGERPEWHAKAACKGVDMFPPRGMNNLHQLIAQTCAVCRVRPDCLAFAVTANEREGIWGGFAAVDRRKLKMALARSKRYAHLGEGREPEVHPSEPAPEPPLEVRMTKREKELRHAAIYGESYRGPRA